MIGAGMRSTQVLGNQAFHDQHVAPYSVELAVIFVNADFAKPCSCNQTAAGLIVEKYAAGSRAARRATRRNERSTYNETSAIPA